MAEFHAEPYIYLAELTYKTALISWGAFYFRVRSKDADGDWKLIDDRDLDRVHPPRVDSIGARSQPYGDARVEVFNPAGELVAFAETTTANHVWVANLEPDTEYRYRILVNGEEWAAGERRDWVATGEKQGLVHSGRRYDNRFRTFPHPEIPSPLTFAVLGDFGTGVKKPSSDTKRQREVAAALDLAFRKTDFRLLITTGDNIYAARTVFGIPIGSTGDEDDDWFFTYYQPYRYILNRVPTYPSVGNHDTGETESSDDRQQLLDNFYLNERFGGTEDQGRASIGPGLFYRFRYGADIEFIAIDTSKNSVLFGKRFFEHPNHAAFLDAAFPAADNTTVSNPSRSDAKWRIPFGHHPPYCAGPQHGNTRSMVEFMVPRLKRSGVRALFAGHEHNFQCSVSEGIHYFTTGGGGKLRMTPPTDFARALTIAWAPGGHFLLAEINGNEMRVSPVGEDDGSGELKVLALSSPLGEKLSAPIIVKI